MAEGRSGFRGPLRRCIDRRYPGWNLDAALRYLPIATHLDRSRPREVLDVGSGGMGLSLYWGRKTTTLDVSPAEPAGAGLVTPVQGSAAALPFRDRSFDVVVCCDVLEHIPPEQRDGVLSELIRTARREVILAVPCGAEAHRAELAVERVFRRRRGQPHPWLRDHLAYGLPEASWVKGRFEALAPTLGRRVSITEKGNVNLALWRFLFGLYFRGGDRTSTFLRTYLLLLLPLLRHANWGQTYRRIFFVTFSLPTEG